MAPIFVSEVFKQGQLSRPESSIESLKKYFLDQLVSGKLMMTGLNNRTRLREIFPPGFIRDRNFFFDPENCTCGLREKDISLNGKSPEEGRRLINQILSSPSLPMWTDLTIEEEDCVRLWQPCTGNSKQPVLKSKKPSYKAESIATELAKLPALPVTVTKDMERTYRANRKTILKAIDIVKGMGK